MAPTVSSTHPAGAATPTLLASGQNRPAPTGPLHLTVSTTTSAALDVCALLVGIDGKVAGDADFVFYNAPTHPSGAVTLQPAVPGRAYLIVQPDEIPAATARVVVAISSDGTPLDQLPGLAIAVAGHGATLMFTPSTLSGQQAAVLVEIYRRDGKWKVRADGQGWSNGLAGLALDFGLTVDDDPSSAPSAQDDIPVPTEPAQHGAADWYSDSRQPGTLCWWDGTTWTTHTRPLLHDTPEQCGRCGAAKRRSWRRNRSTACRNCEAQVAAILPAWRAEADQALQTGGPLSPQFAQLWTDLRFHRIDPSTGAATLAPLVAPYLDRLVGMAFADGVIEDHEIAAFDADVSALSTRVPVDPSVASNFRGMLVRGRDLSRIRDGALPAVQTAFHLDTDEIAHLEVNATHIRFLASGPKRSEGTLLITNKKLRFLSQSGGIELAWSRVLGVVPATGLVEVRASNARGGATFAVTDSVRAEAIITGAVRIAKRLVLDPGRRDSRRIPQHVKTSVWQRDGGRCIECGSTEYLEFDHIIPHSKGGASSENNVQLLCRGCNAKKSDRI